MYIVFRLIGILGTLLLQQNKQNPSGLYLDSLTKNVGVTSNDPHGTLKHKLVILQREPIV